MLKGVKEIKDIRSIICSEMTNHISYLNQIFYKYKKFEKDDVVQMENWMLTSKFIDHIKLPKYGKTVWIRISKKTESTEKCLKSPDSQKDESKIDKMKNPQKTESTEKFLKEAFHRDQMGSRFLSKKQDTLFWAIYVAKYGEAEYYQIGNKYKNVEISEKMKLVQFMSQCKTNIQQQALNIGKKIPSTKMQEWQADFMVNKKTSYSTFWIMCMYYNINAILFKEYLYMKFYSSTDPSDICIFFEDKQGYVSFDEQSYSSEKLKEMFDTRIFVDHTSDRIFKGESAYSIEELHHFASILGITQQITNQYKKPSKKDWMRELQIFLSSI